MTTVNKLLVQGLIASLYLFGLNLNAENSDFTIPVQGKSLSNDSLKKNNAAFHLSTTITSKHLWRAMPSGTAACIEPMVSFSNNGFAISAWASFALNNSYKELDLWATYTWKNFQIGLFDYYCPSETAASNEFLEFDKTETRHLFESQISWLGSEKFPLSVMAACFIGGSDLDQKQKQLYSSYFELNYPLLRGKHNIVLTMGGTPAKSMYASKACVFNYAVAYSSSIKITKKWKLPFEGKLVHNSQQKKTYFSLSITIK